MHTAELSEDALMWRAVWETGLNIAALDATTALKAAGMTGFTDKALHVSVPHGCDPGKVIGVMPHRIPRRLPDEILNAGVPRVRPHLAALRAAHWAVSDRPAALILCLAVQQRIVTPQQLRDASAVISGRRRRRLVKQLILDVGDGAHSLGELNFASLCRERGLPEPSRQVVRHGPTGRIYLDVRWDGIGLVVEIDGAQHRQGLAVMDDNLRQNRVVIEGDVVLHVDLVGLRLAPDDFMDQVCEAFRQLSLRKSG